MSMLIDGMEINGKIIVTAVLMWLLSVEWYFVILVGMRLYSNGCSQGFSSARAKMGRVREGR